MDVVIDRCGDFVSMTEQCQSTRYSHSGAEWFINWSSGKYPRVSHTSSMPVKEAASIEKSLRRQVTGCDPLWTSASGVCSLGQHQ
jgi:hypothetical protein